MARQKSIIKLEGTIGDISFYKTQDGHLARTKGGVSADRIKNDDAFQRTRENNSEFGRAGEAGKLLRMTFQTLLKRASDNRMVSRLTKEMVVVVKADETNVRGERNVLDGELELLEGFDFNIHSKLSSTLYAPYTATIDRVSGALQVNIPAMSPADRISSPQGATHVKLVSAGASIDFEGGIFEVITSESGDIKLSPTAIPDIVLTNQLTANSTHPLFLILGIEFYQEVNTILYPLKNGRFNALAIVKILGV